MATTTLSRSPSHSIPFTGWRMAIRSRDDKRRSIELVTRGCSRITGYTAEELLSGNVGLLDLTDPEDREFVSYELRDSVLRPKPLDVTYRIKTKSGKSVWVSECSCPSFCEGRIVHTGFIEEVQPRAEKPKYNGHNGHNGVKASRSAHKVRVTCE